MQSLDPHLPQVSSPEPAYPSLSKPFPSSEFLNLPCEKVEHLPLNQLNTSDIRWLGRDIIPSNCVVCGVAGMCTLCENEECANYVHPWCSSLQHLSPFSLPRCPSHSQSRKCDWKVHSPGWSASLCEDSAVISAFRAQSSNDYSAHLCTGAVFWYVLCSQYFPGMVLDEAPPKFSQLVGGYGPRNVLQWLKEKEGKWDLDASLQATESSLAATHAQVSTLLSDLHLSQCQYSSSLSSVVQDMTNTSKTTEDEWVLKDIKLVELKKLNRSYLQYFEKKERVVMPEVTVKSSKSGEARGGDEDFPCAICGDGDYEDDDLIIICDTCELGVHTKCYGIQQVPEGSWVCDMCLTFGKSASKSLPCALCPNKGGILKRTTHPNNGSIPAQHYPVFRDTEAESERNPKEVWCHVFCIMRVPKVQITDQERVNEISLEHVELRRFNMRCEVCGSRDGACIKCGQKRCGAAFHPECGKTFFLYAGFRMGKSLENEIFCNQHRTFKLRKLVELKERCQMNEISAFFREWEKWKPKYDLETSSTRLWTPEESQLLEDQISLFLTYSYCGPQIPFTITVQKESPYTIVQMPIVCNLMESKVILQNGITIPNRSAEECCKQYELEIYGKMLKNLEEAGKPVLLLQGKKPQPKKSHKKKTSKTSHKAILASSPRKRSHKGKVQAPMKKKKISVPLTPVVTSELFCICRKPYIQLLPQLAGESESAYSLKIRNNSMLQCAACVQWFHLGCVGYRGSAEDAEKEDGWKCAECAKKST